MLNSLLQDITWSASFQSVYQRFRPIFDSKWTFVILFALSTLRVVLNLMAYAPADGADGLEYLLQSSYLAGYSVPQEFASFSPLYPLMIYLTAFVGGSPWITVGLQAGLSLMQGIFYYIGMRKLSPAFAFLIAIVIICDFQSAVLYSFFSTEPLYMTLMAAVFASFCLQVLREDSQRLYAGDILLALLITALLLTRSVARFILLPLGLLFFVFSRSAKRTGIIIIACLVWTFTFSTAYTFIFGRSAPVGSNNNDVLIYQALYRSGELKPDNGEATAELLRLDSLCRDDTTTEIPIRCMTEAAGSVEALQNLLNKSWFELVKNSPFSYVNLVFQEFTNFNTMSGLQYYGDTSPASVQCANLPDRLEKNYQAMQEHRLFANLEIEDRAGLREAISVVTGWLCPPYQENTLIRAGLEAVARQYRSISRPNFWLWWLVLGSFLIFVKWAKPYILPVSFAWLLLVYHASINSVILNVQPRYVVVTNPFKIILVMGLLWISMNLALRALDAIFFRNDSVKKD